MGRRLAPLAAVAAALAVALAVAWCARGRWVHWRVEQHLPLIEKMARQNGMDPDLIASVVEAESGGDPYAQSSVGALGLMQITPVTLAEVRDRRHAVGAGSLTDPAYNLAVGCAYLAQLRERFHGDPSLMMAAYHMGPSRVARWLVEHPGQDGQALVADAAATGPKTRAYVAGVLALWEDRRRERLERAASN